MQFSPFTRFLYAAFAADHGSARVVFERDHRFACLVDISANAAFENAGKPFRKRGGAFVYRRNYQVAAAVYKAEGFLLFHAAHILFESKYVVVFGCDRFLAVTRGKAPFVVLVYLYIYIGRMFDFGTAGTQFFALLFCAFFADAVGVQYPLVFVLFIAFKNCWIFYIF